VAEVVEVVEVRDGKSWEGAHPSRTLCGKSSKVSRGKSTSSGLRLAQIITALRVPAAPL